MNNEILNIDHNIKQLLVKALNKCPGDAYAAGKLLGVSRRTVVRYKKRYRIKRKHTLAGVIYVIDSRPIIKLKIA